jgi:hypothetical protein
VHLIQVYQINSHLNHIDNEKLMEFYLLLNLLTNITNTKVQFEFFVLLYVKYVMIQLIVEHLNLNIKNFLLKNK